MNITVCTDEINRSSIKGPTYTRPVAGAITGLNVYLTSLHDGLYHVQGPPVHIRGRYSSMISHCLPHTLICEVLNPSLFVRKKLKNSVENKVFLVMKQDLNGLKI